MGDTDDLGLQTQVQLPGKFRMPSLLMFDGLGYPTTHVKWYLLIMKMIGLGDDQITLSLYH